MVCVIVPGFISKRSPSRWLESAHIYDSVVRPDVRVSVESSDNAMNGGMIKRIDENSLRNFVSPKSGPSLVQKLSRI